MTNPSLDGPVAMRLRLAGGGTIVCRRLLLARERPALALEMGIGRPDLPNAQPAGLVDLNNAPAAAIARLPGVDDALATQIVRARSDTHGFSSVEDLGAALDLDGHLVEDLRDCVVFLPRAQ